MSTRPDLILQYVHMIAGDFHEKGYDQIEVRVKVESSLNGRDTQLLIDPDVDLAKQPREWIPHRAWIVPLK